MESGLMDTYDIKRTIEKFNLDPSCNSYIIDKHFSRGNFQEAIQYAEENDIIITPQQFGNYINRQESLRKAEEERKRKLAEERRVKSIEMMGMNVSGKSLCTIEYEKDQKYILIYTPEMIQLASYNSERHRDIASRVNVAMKYVVCGGRIVVDDSEKTIRLYGSSGDFGETPKEYYQVIENILKTQYP